MIRRSHSIAFCILLVGSKSLQTTSAPLTRSLVQMAHVFPGRTRVTEKPTVRIGPMSPPFAVCTTCHSSSSHLPRFILPSFSIFNSFLLGSSFFLFFFSSFLLSFLSTFFVGSFLSSFLSYVFPASHPFLF